MIPIGHKKCVEGNSIIAILRPDSAPAKSLRHSAEKSKMLIDSTSGRKARSIILLDSNHLVLSALQPETLKKKFKEMMSDHKDDFMRHNPSNLL